MTIMEKALTALPKFKNKIMLEPAINALIHAMESGNQADIAFAEKVVEVELEELKIKQS